MRYLLDTNICIALMKRSSEQLKHEVLAHAADRLEVSVITVAELAWGTLRSSRQLQAERRLVMALTARVLVGKTPQREWLVVDLTKFPANTNDLVR